MNIISFLPTERPYTFAIDHGHSMHFIMIPNVLKLLILIAMITSYIILRKRYQSSTNNKQSILSPVTIALVIGGLIISLWSDFVLVNFRNHNNQILQSTLHPDDAAYKHMDSLFAFLIEARPFIQSNYRIITGQTLGIDDAEKRLRWKSLFLYPPYRPDPNATLIIVLDSGAHYDNNSHELTMADTSTITNIVPVHIITGASGIYRRRSL